MKILWFLVRIHPCTESKRGSHLVLAEKFAKRLLVGHVLNKVLLRQDGWSLVSFVVIKGLLYLGRRCPEGEEGQDVM
jgi:hypothetical protein